MTVAAAWKVKKEMLTGVPTRERIGAPIPTASSNRRVAGDPVPVLAEHERKNRTASARASLERRNPAREPEAERPDTAAIPTSTGRYRTFHEA
jgi:hypothetical protein